MCDLGFGLDFNVEGVDPGGEDSGETLSGERVEEVKPWLRQLLEAAPPLHHSYARLLHAPTEYTRHVSHLSFSLSFWIVKPLREIYVFVFSLRNGI